MTNIVPARQSGGLTQWTPAQVDLIRQQVCEGASDDELAFFAQVCGHRELDPFAGEIVGIMRWNGKEQRNVMRIQVTVEGLRTIAARTGLYGGQDEVLWCGPDGQWLDIWPNPEQPPYAAKTAVYRVDVDRPFVGKAHFHEFCQFDSKGRKTPMWEKMPANQLAKCAERQALIRAFKKELRAAGITLEDDLPVQSRISMEARHAGLDDDDRHALVAEVTGGRTESTRDLVDHPDDVLAVRSEIARRRAPIRCTAAGPGGTETYWYDPDTGERVAPPSSEDAGGGGEVREAAAGEDPDPGPETEPTPPNVTQTPAPGGNPAGYVDETGRVHVPPEEALSPEETERRRLIADLVPRSRALDGDSRALLHSWLDGAGIGSAKKVKDYTLDELNRTAEAITEFEKPLDEEPF